MNISTGFLLMDFDNDRILNPEFGSTKAWSIPVAVTAAEFYDLVQSGDYAELLWVDRKRQVKVYGCVQFVGSDKPIAIIARNGDSWVMYRLALEDRAVILVRKD